MRNAAYYKLYLEAHSYIFVGHRILVLGLVGPMQCSTGRNKSSQRKPLRNLLEIQDRTEIIVRHLPVAKTKANPFQTQ